MKQHAADAAALVVRVDNENVDFAHVVVGVKSGADPSDRMPALDSDIHAFRFGVEDFC
jgi:hypothetical protein